VEDVGSARESPARQDRVTPPFVELRVTVSKDDPRFSSASGSEIEIEYVSDTDVSEKGKLLGAAMVGGSFDGCTKSDKVDEEGNSRFCLSRATTVIVENVELWTELNSGEGVKIRFARAELMSAMGPSTLIDVEEADVVVRVDEIAVENEMSPFDEVRETSKSVSSRSLRIIGLAEKKNAASSEMARAAVIGSEMTGGSLMSTTDMSIAC
jgi:hypothetical protein